MTTLIFSVKIPLMEYERPRQESAVQQDASQEAFRRFIAGLQAMSLYLEGHVQNFAWCAGQIARNHSASSELRGMLEFGLRLQEFGLEIALDEMRENAGIPVTVAIPESRTREKPGIICGIVGAKVVNGQKVFDGVVMMLNSRGQEAFVKVDISPNGETSLQHESVEIKEPETVRLMRELYPEPK